MADKGTPKFKVSEKILLVDIANLRLNLEKFELEELQMESRKEQLEINSAATIEAIANKENSLEALREAQSSGSLTESKED